MSEEKLEPNKVFNENEGYYAESDGSYHFNDEKEETNLEELAIGDKNNDKLNNKLDELVNLMKKIDESMKMSEDFGLEIQIKEEEIYEEKRPAMVEKKREELAKMKADKEEFDDMTKNALVNAKKMIVSLKNEEEQSFQNKLSESLEKQRELKSKRQSIDSKTASLISKVLNNDNIKDADKQVKVQKIQENAEQSKQNFDNELNNVNSSAQKLSEEHSSKMADLNNYEQKVKNYAIKLNVIDEIDKINTTGKEQNEQKQNEQTTGRANQSNQTQDKIRNNSEEQIDITRGVHISAKESKIYYYDKEGTLKNRDASYKLKDYKDLKKQLVGLKENCQDKEQRRLLSKIIRNYRKLDPNIVGLLQETPDKLLEYGKSILDARKNKETKMPFNITYDLRERKLFRGLKMRQLANSVRGISGVEVLEKQNLKSGEETKKLSDNSRKQDDVVEKYSAKVQMLGESYRQASNDEQRNDIIEKYEMLAEKGCLSESDNKYFQNIVDNSKGRETKPEEKSKEQNNDDRGMGQ